MNTAFQKAKDNLKIKSVTMRNSIIELNNDIEPFQLNDFETETQSYREPAKVKQMYFKSNEKEHWEYSFFYSVGIRLVESNGAEQDSEADEEPNVLVVITAVYSALYRSEIQLEKEAIDAFAEENVGYHVWPYWREFVQSSAGRLNVPAPEIPFYFCNNRVDCDDDASTTE